MRTVTRRTVVRVLVVFVRERKIRGWDTHARGSVCVPCMRVARAAPIVVENGSHIEMRAQCSPLLAARVIRPLGIHGDPRDPLELLFLSIVSSLPPFHSSHPSPSAIGALFGGEGKNWGAGRRTVASETDYRRLAESLSLPLLYLCLPLSRYSVLFSSLSFPPSTSFFSLAPLSLRCELLSGCYPRTRLCPQRGRAVLISGE